MAVGVAVAALWLVGAGPALAQQRGVASGRVLLLGEKDSLPVAGVRVVLHRVGHAVQGPVDSTFTDEGGSYRFRFVQDTSAAFLISARYDGIEYFSGPLSTTLGTPDSGIVITVSDTASNAPVTLEARYLVVRKASADGQRQVLDLLFVTNRGWLTRISPDSTVPTWAGALPRGAAGARVTESDFSEEAVAFRRDSVFVFAPLSPGQKQLAVEYTLRSPGGEIELPFASERTVTNVLLEEMDASVSGGGLAPADTQLVETTRFIRWVGAPPANTTVRIRFGGATGTNQRYILIALVGFAVAALVAGAWWARRRAPTTPAGKLGRITDEIATLDARYQGRKEQVPPDEWQRYLTDRERLRAEAAVHLATR